jgi:hypothetical protein
MVQFRAIDKRISEDEMVRLFEENVSNIRNVVLTKMAEQIAMRSAATVDTGTYASSHRVGQRSGSFAPTQTSHRKPRNQQSGPSVNKGLQQMLSDIEGLPKDAPNVVFRNEAIHAKYVETIGWGNRPPYKIYAATRREFNTIVRDALAELGMKST